MTPAKSAPKSKTASQVWAALYDLESGVGAGERQAPRTRRGRPPSPNPRKPVMLYLTDQEQTLIPDLVARLHDALPNGTVSRSQTVGFALRVLVELVEKRGLSPHGRAPDWASVADQLLKEP